MKVKVKVWGSKDGVERFFAEIDEKFMALISYAKPSDQGDWHGYATVEVRE